MKKYLTVLVISSLISSVYADIIIGDTTGGTAYGGSVRTTIGATTGGTAYGGVGGSSTGGTANTTGGTVGATTGGTANTTGGTATGGSATGGTANNSNAGIVGSGGAGGTGGTGGSVGAVTTGGNTQTVSTSGTVGSVTSGGNTQSVSTVDPNSNANAKVDAAARVEAARLQADAIKEASHQKIYNTPSVNGPPLVSSNDTCMGSSSGSLNIPGLGIGLGKTYVDENCVRLKQSREIWNMGMKSAALALMCQDLHTKEALEVTGYKCPDIDAYRKEKSASVKVSEPVHEHSGLKYPQ